VIFAGSSFVDVVNVIVVYNYPLISILPPEIGSNFYRLSALFSDSHDQPTLRIHENEWFAGADNWDVECVGPRITIRSRPRDISLVLKSEPRHRIIVEKLNMEYEGFILKGNEGSLEISSDGGIKWNTIKGANIKRFHNGLTFRN
jgi:hypothetical protein